MGNCSCKTSCTEGKKECGSKKAAKTNSGIILMAAHKALHSPETDSWRCRLCEDMGKHTQEGILAHLKSFHRLPAKTLVVDGPDGSIFTPWNGED